MPALWRALLAEAAGAPDGVLSLKEDPRGEEAVDAAERLTDLGLLRIVTARRYRLSEAGRAALAAQGGRKSRAAITAKPAPVSETEAPRGGLWSRLFGPKS